MNGFRLDYTLAVRILQKVLELANLSVQAVPGVTCKGQDVSNKVPWFHLWSLQNVPVTLPRLGTVLS